MEEDLGKFAGLINEINELIREAKGKPNKEAVSTLQDIFEKLLGFAAKLAPEICAVLEADGRNEEIAPYMRRAQQEFIEIMKLSFQLKKIMKKN